MQSHRAVQPHSLVTAQLYSSAAMQPYPNLLKMRKMDTVFAILDTVAFNIGVFLENGYLFPKFGYAYV